LIKTTLKNKLPNLFRLLRRLKHPTEPIPLGLWMMNFFVQRVFGVNRNVPFMVHYTSFVTHADKIILGENVWKSFALSGGCYIQGNNGIEIGDSTIFAPGVKIISANHDPSDLAKHISEAPVRIGKNCWIGANAIILPGVDLGDGSIVGAGAVVTRSFPTGSLLVGVPARKVNLIIPLETSAGSGH
jgi:acetyltransferase-like isoleucine patch superfamily enzyme